MLEGEGLSSVVRMGVILVVISFVLALLPESPFVAYMHALEDTTWLKYFNWVVWVKVWTRSLWITIPRTAAI